MAINLSIKSVPEEWAERLRQRAERNHRSLQGELMALVEAAVSQDALVPAVRHAEPRPQGLRRGTQTVEQLAQVLDARRARGLVPSPGLPTGTDIIRADRDRR